MYIVIFRIYTSKNVVSRYQTSNKQNGSGQRVCYSDENSKQRNITNREMKLAIADELKTLFHPIVSATKQAAEETRKSSRQ